MKAFRGTLDPWKTWQARKRTSKGNKVERGKAGENGSFMGKEESKAVTCF